jgi:hypothetical protein
MEYFKAYSNFLRVWLTDALRASVKEEFNIIIFGDCIYFYGKEEKSWHFSGFVRKTNRKDKKNFSFTPIKQGYYSK